MSDRFPISGSEPEIGKEDAIAQILDLLEKLSVDYLVKKLSAMPAGELKGWEDRYVHEVAGKAFRIKRCLQPDKENFKLAKALANRARLDATLTLAPYLKGHSGTDPVVTAEIIFRQSDNVKEIQELNASTEGIVGIFLNIRNIFKKIENIAERVKVGQYRD